MNERQELFLKNFPEMIEQMKKKVLELKAPSSYAFTDTLLDVSAFLRKIVQDELPDNVYWLVRSHGTSFAYPDKRIKTSSLYGYLVTNLNSLEAKREEETCFCLDFVNGTITEMTTQEIVAIISKSQESDYTFSTLVESTDVYLKGLDYAKDKGELALYYKSQKINQEALKCFSQMVKDHSTFQDYGQRVDTKSIAEELQKFPFSKERLEYLFMTRVYVSLLDGRFSENLKQRARDYYKGLPAGMKYPEVLARNTNDDIHPTILNRIIEVYLNSAPKKETPQIDRD